MLGALCGASKECTAELWKVCEQKPDCVHEIWHLRRQQGEISELQVPCWPLICLNMMGLAMPRPSPLCPSSLSWLLWPRGMPPVLLSLSERHSQDTSGGQLSDTVN